MGTNLGGGGGGGGGTPSFSTSHYEGGDLIRAGVEIPALGPDLMGDRVNLYSGSLSFNQTDVSLPGNNNLPVAVGRRLVMGNKQGGRMAQGLFGDWDLEIPHMSTVAAVNGGRADWFGTSDFLNGNTLRCSQWNAPPPGDGYLRGNRTPVQSRYWWDGYHLYVPGVGDQTPVKRLANNTMQPGDGFNYPIVTKNNWQIRCLPSLANGPGEGFFARAPDGSTYQFDHIASRAYPSYKPPGEELPWMTLGRSEVWIMPTQVTDRFGNWVRYTYDSSDAWRVNAISSSDGRTIWLSYVAGTHRISWVSDGSRVWTYAYAANNTLQTVQLPDASTWQFSLGSLEIDPFFVTDPGCDGFDPVDTSIRTGTVVHPSGAIGTFNLQFTWHGRSNVPGSSSQCWMPFSTNLVPLYSATMSLVSKTLAGPGMDPMTWSYSYSAPSGSWAPCSGCVDRKTVTIADPLGNITKNTYGTQYGLTDGLLLMGEEGWTQNGSLRTTTLTYRLPTTGPYLSDIGTVGATPSDSMGHIYTPEDSRSTVQGGATFSRLAPAAPGGFDSLARPTSHTAFSNLGYSRTETTVYKDYPQFWVLSLPWSHSVSDGSNNFVDRSLAYDDATGLPSSSFTFGKLQASYTFNLDGTLYQVRDGLSQATTFTNYLRGLAQRIQFADGTAISAVVNNIGTINTATNEAGTTWNYGYDAMGRLGSISPPAGDPLAYNTNVLSFVQVAADEKGIGPNHWRQTITQGNAVTVNYFDARWRKRLTTTYDAANPAATERMQRFDYDPYNRTTFAAYPARSIDTITSSVAGMRTVYDALGRIRQTLADSELGVLSTSVVYLNGFVKQVINPRGFANAMTFQAFDEPSEGAPTGVWEPEGVSVGISRDLLGKPTAITRSGAYSGSGPASVTRSYVYDTHQQLCKTVEPESGATVQGYDNANNVIWRASGLSPDSNCDGAPGSRTISYGYDARNRLTSTSYGDGSPGITHSYTPDGLLQQVVSHHPANPITWNYYYNNRRLLAREQYAWWPGAIGPWDGWSFSYNIDANGHVSALTDPWGQVAYAPNALGQPTQVSGYASNVAYHPNGAVNSYLLNNGITHYVGLNTRGLPQWWNDGGVVNDAYTYDANSNVSSIADYQEGGSTSRSMGYDGLDRLTQANGVWGGGSFYYDALDNMRRSTIGSRDLWHNYDDKNRLASDTGTQTINYGYDANGKVTNRGGQAFVFDIGNRLSSAPGAVNAYIYDGHGRRNLVGFASGDYMHQVYTKDGKLRFAWRPSQGGRRHVYLGNRLIAETDEAQVTTFMHTDALGSPVASTNQSGQVLTRTRYEPYGATAAGTNPSRIGFTEHVNDPETGLVYMQQRYYDSSAGRFLSVDPVTTDAKTGDSFNRYVYGRNNPFKFKDPDGRFAETLWDIASLALSVNEFRSNPSIGNAIGVAVDAAAVIIPGIPGGVGAVRAATKAAEGAADVAGAGRAANKLKPVEGAEGAHSAIKTGADGKVTNTATYTPNPKNPSGFDEAKRVDVTGKAHTNSDGTKVSTPHVHEAGQKDVRPARPDELPK